MNYTVTFVRRRCPEIRGKHQRAIQRGGHRVVRPVDRRGYGDDDLLVLAPVDSQPLPPYLSQGAPHDSGRDQDIVGLAADRVGQELLLDLARRVGEQDEADRGRRQRQPASDAVLHRRGAASVACRPSRTASWTC